MFGKVKDIKSEVCRKWGFTFADLEGKNKTKMLARARIEAMARVRKETKHSFPEIGFFFGRRHHSTVMYACKIYAKHPEFFHNDLCEDPKKESAFLK